MVWVFTVLEPTLSFLFLSPTGLPRFPGTTHTEGTSDPRRVGGPRLRAPPVPSEWVRKGRVERWDRGGRGEGSGDDGSTEVNIPKQNKGKRVLFGEA